MNCQGYRTHLRAALEGVIRVSEREEAERHLSQCKECGAFHKRTYGISCRELTESLDDYVGGSLDPAHHVVFERHLSICIECREYADGYRRTIALGRAAFTDAGDGSLAVPESFVRGVLRARRGRG
jgi:anti-sigma factor RsiW